jgi:phosphatidylglycerophosphate synthase
VRSVRAQMVPGLVSMLAVLVGLELGVGLTPGGWALGIAFDTATLALLGRAVARSGPPRPRPANLVTLARAALVGGVAALVANSLRRPVDVAVLVALAAVALALDGVDGWLARRTGTASALGGRFDLEVDAFLILVLSGYAARSLGAWVLLIGLARYLLLAAGYVWPWLQRDSPARYWAKVVAATQGVVLTVVAADWLARPVEIVLTVAALALLAESFGRQVVWLSRDRAGSPGRPRAVVGQALTALAVVLVWSALAWPDRLDRLSAGNFGQIPVEGLVLAAAALVLPGRARQLLAAVAGGALGVLVLLKALDMGYYAELDRAFNPVIEWSSLKPAVGVLRDSRGALTAYAAVGGAVLLAVAVVALLSWASLRVARLSATHRRSSSWVVGALAVVWAGSAVVGVDVTPHTAVASGWTTSFATTEVRNVAAAAKDRRLFPDQLTAADAHSKIPASSLLSGLRGKDVIVAFVESYGQTAVQGSSFAPGVVKVLDTGTRQLTAAGYSARSGFLTSPTFGGLSWLAHSTLQSGLWIDNQQRYNQLVKSKRYTLSDAFKEAGWRTVSDDPSDLGPWPEGTSFYHYDQVYNGINTGYQGPAFSYAKVPDPFTLTDNPPPPPPPDHAPVMAEIDLVSSHYPWTPLPHLVPWDALGDGSIFDPMPAQGPTVPELYKNYDNVRASYGKSIQYSIQSLVSFVQNADDPNLVLVLLGDHQPAPKVSGPGATHDVPISIVARDPAVLSAASSWGWQPGLRPAGDGPVWSMDAFRNRFLDTFSTQRTTVSAALKQ